MLWLYEIVNSFHMMSNLAVLPESFLSRNAYTRGGHICRDEEPKTIEAINEKAATQFLIYLN